MPYDLLSAERSFDYPNKENTLRAFKLRVHGMADPKGLSMPRVGIILSTWQFMAASDRPMGRKLDAEATWVQIAGGYIMPLSPRHWGVNLALARAVDLLGVQYRTYYAEVWGRPVGVTVAKDGALLVTDDGANLIWRVSYVGR